MATFRANKKKDLNKVTHKDLEDDTDSWERETEHVVSGPLQNIQKELENRDIIRFKRGATKKERKDFE